MSKRNPPSLKQQMYIEAIADLLRAKGRARISDLAELLAVQSPSVSEAVGRLCANKLVKRKSWHEVGLTAHGRAVARQLEQRHLAIRRFLAEFLFIDDSKSDRVACALEHWVDRNFTERLLRLANFLRKREGGNIAVLRSYVKTGRWAQPEQAEGHRAGKKR